MRWPMAADPLSSSGLLVRTRRSSKSIVVALTCVLLAACTAQPPPPPQTPPASTTPSTSQSPTLSPTPASARDRALAESKQAYIDYTRALDKMGNAGGGDTIPDYLSRHLSPEGPAREYYEQDAKELKSGRFKGQGSAVLRDLRVLNITDLDEAIPEAHWQACVDQSGVTVTKNGEPFEHPKYLDEQVELHLDKESGRWLVYDFNSRALPDGDSCGGGK